MDLLDGFNVILVRSKASHVWDKGMKNVITALKSIGIYPEWKKPAEILELSLTKKTVLVMADFSSDHFSEFVESGCLIVGPNCLTECIDNKVSIPDNGSPIFNMAMADLIVTGTNMPKKKKEEIKKYIGWMGGCYTNSFTLSHTHLVAETVNSEKCHAAAEKQKPILNFEWVSKVWEASLEDPKLRADSPDIVSKYRLPAFKGLEITLSNLSSALKKKYKKFIEDNGGVCSGSLTQKQTHYVVSNKCEGEKVKSALAWGDVHVVNSDWIEKSVVAMGPLPPKEFSLKQRPTCSTPTSELPSFMSAVDISVVGGPNSTTGSNHIEETLNTTGRSVASYVPISKPVAVKHPSTSALVILPSPAPASELKSNLQTSSYDDYKKIVEDLKLADVSKAGSFLDGCKVYLSGWSGNEGDKLRRLLIKGGATVLTKVARGVTHIVAADLPSDHSNLTNTSGCQKMVTVEWVRASLEEGKPVDASPYLIAAASQGKPPPPSPLSHKGLELLQSKTKSSQENCERNETGQDFRAPVSRKLFEKTPRKKLLSSVADCDTSLGLDAMPYPEEHPEPAPSISTTQREKVQNLTSTQKSSESDITNTRVFQGLVFVVLGFDSDSSADIVKVIESQGGSVVLASFQGVPDYAVLPIEGVPDKFTSSEVVNALWIEECFDLGYLVDIQYYHQPVSIRAPGVSLSSSIICFSGFPAKEKIFLSHLAAILGATVQEAFSRRDNPAKGVLRSTHLISSEACGSKYEAAIKWGIPAISKSWLLEAAAKSAESSPPPYHPYSLSKIQPNQDNIDSTPLNSKSVKSNCSATPLAVGNKTGSQLPRTASHPINTASALPNDKEAVLPPPEAPQQNETSQLLNENLTPITTRSVKITKDSSKSSSSMFPNPGGDGANKFNVSLSNPVGTKRKSGDRSPLREHNSPAAFLSPQNQQGKMAKLLDSTLNDTRSPFHVDTPEEPLGRIFYSNPDKRVTKIYKKYIDSFPDFKPETPVIPPKKSSPPTQVLMKQIMAQLGQEVDGIEKGTGKLLKGGIYSEWANSSAESSFNKSVVEMDNNCSNKICEETPCHSRKKSPSHEVKSSERRKSSSDRVTELRNLMAEIQKSSGSGDCQEDISQGVEQCILERLQAEPGQVLNDIRSHPLNKIRPNSEHLFDAERPSTSSMDKEDGSTKGRAASSESIASQLDPDETHPGAETQLEDGTPTQPVPKQLFMLSSLPVGNKEKYEGLIKGLGGEVCTSSIYEEPSTHLIMAMPVRNEKLLCSIAAGKWVLHTSYLDQCYERRCFLPEESYEWGNPLSESRLPKLDVGSQKQELASAAYRWRKNSTNLNQRAFRHMKAVVFSRQESKAMFTRVLLAGGAQILDDLNSCNICFIEEGKVEIEMPQLEILASRSVPCVPLIYISIYLTNYPRIDPNDYLIQQYIPLLKKK